MKKKKKRKAKTETHFTTNRSSVKEILKSVPQTRLLDKMLKKIIEIKSKMKW